MLPELLRSGYVFASAQEARDLAEPADARPRPRSPTSPPARPRRGGGVRRARRRRIPAQQRAAAGPQRDPDRLPQGAPVGRGEGRLLVPGDDLPEVVATPWGRLALAVCYDLGSWRWMRLIGWPAPTSCARRRTGPCAAGPHERRWRSCTSRRRVGEPEVSSRVRPDRSERGVTWVVGSAVVGPDGRRSSRRRPGRGSTSCSRGAGSGGRGEEHFGAQRRARRPRPELYAGPAHALTLGRRSGAGRAAELISTPRRAASTSGHVEDPQVPDLPRLHRPHPSPPRCSATENRSTRWPWACPPTGQTEPHRERRGNRTSRRGRSPSGTRESARRRARRRRRPGRARP